MAYGNNFLNYPQYYSNPQNAQNNYQMPQIPTAQPTQQSTITWVQGIAGAKSYLVAPNNTVQLWDSEAQTIYLKSADASGMPSMKILDYTIREQEATQKPLQALENEQSIIYATKEDLKALKGEIIDMVREEMKA